MLVNIAREPMVLLLILASALYVVFGDAAEAGALAVSVVVVVAITVVQERRTERALDALRDLASPQARVLRDGKWEAIDARLLVPGDAIHLTEGDRVPADSILRTGTPVTADESLLTGESVPVIRHPGADIATMSRPGEEGASLFAGTLIGSGNGTAEVIATGARTEVGRIGAALGTIEMSKAPLYREIGRVVRRLAIVAIVICVVLVGINIASGRGWLESALSGITLAMSLLPEELPVVLTVFLALGARRIAKHRVLARRGSAIEALGAVTVLCVDKTGTLTQNQMRIGRLVGHRGVHEVSAERGPLPDEVHEIVEFGMLACPQEPADPMDRAFVSLARLSLADTEHIHPTWTWVREYPLRPGLLAVTHVWRGDDQQRAVVATKGAPEAIIDLCHLPSTDAERWRERAESLAREGYRVLGVARTISTEALPPSNPHDFPFELVGLVGLADPLRPDTAATIAQCRDAGIRVVMITGDHPDTARAIARSAGLGSADVVTGRELEALDDHALGERLARVDVIARAAPAHKLRIVQALRDRGEIVGMTGDGVNDAPALKAADVGIAMGKGTDVAREAAGLVILDEALGSIVAAVRTGRAIYDNLRKVASYLLAVHVPIAGLALIPPLVGWPILLAPVHVVLLELVIDPTCSIVFELESPEADIMKRPPRRHTDHLFTSRRIVSSIGFGVLALAGPLVVVGWAYSLNMHPEMARVLGFSALIAANLALVVAIVGVRKPHNPALPWLVGAVVALTGVILSVPWLRGLFAFATPAPWVLAGAVLTGVLPVLLGAILWRPGAARSSELGVVHARLPGS